jgi:hypothetical protein
VWNKVSENYVATVQRLFSELQLEAAKFQSSFKRSKFFFPFVLFHIIFVDKFFPRIVEGRK